MSPEFQLPIFRSIGVVVGFFFLFSSCKDPEQKKWVGELFVPEVLTFAGDTIPLSDPDIRERLERELWINQYWQASTVQWMKKGGKWLPTIDSILRKNQVPEDFKYLVAIESGFENVTSNKGAAGFWQIMDPTGREFGLRINDEMDERLHLEKATEAAAKLLLRGRNVFKKWPETAVSYNIGVSGLKSVLQGQYTDSFYDLVINAESGRYLFRILAAKLILTYPEKYGYASLAPYSMPAFRKELLTKSEPDLAFWCKQNNFSYKCFRALNPWVKSNSLTITDSSGPLEVKIPLDCRVFSQLELSEKRTNDSTGANLSVLNNLVNKKDVKALKEKESEDDLSLPFHEIGAGENLGFIARQYNLSMAELFRLNPGLERRQNKIQKGQKLRIKE